MTPTFGRIPVLDIWPTVSGGTRPTKAVINEELTISATVFREGHDSVATEVVLIDPFGKDSSRHRMALVGLGTDRFEVSVSFPTMGMWSYRIEAWSDPIGTWLHHVDVKIPANVDVELEFAEGAVLLNRIIASVVSQDSARLNALLATITNTTLSPAKRLEAIQESSALAVLARNPIRELVSNYGPFPVKVERQRALYGSWYEFFPRSEGATQKKNGSWTSGTFKTAAKRLPAVAEMGFHVLYLPPIHPIGESFRKGPNNTLTPGPNDPGSPWAIGSSAGGHDAIHPDLGTEKDFVAFIKAANKLGIEIAMDLALQASPDHPWVTTNPEWFTTRVDGTIAYAENPPKKYQDIYPINFDNDPEGIFNEVRRIVQHWVKLGVRIFRVDNPHTKPVEFWERLLADINSTYPDVIFLAEAFTRPAMMRALGEAGFQQSYTYFTWRNTKQELIDYLNELSGFASPFMRPNFFVNTPDILPEYLQLGGPNAFAIRALLAATLAPTWGVYAGFELYEYVALKAGGEEYLDSEKFQYRPRDWDTAAEQGKTLAPFIKKLNAIREAHPALQQLRDITFHRSDSDSVLCFSKRSGDDIVIVLVTVDPAIPRESGVHFTMPALGLDWSETFTAVDELSGESFTLQEHNHFVLDPHNRCGYVLTMRKP